MDRQLHKKYIPECPRVGASSLVDQYMWQDKDTNYYRCFNGISHPIYDCKGWVNYSLPLDQYPRVGEIHPQIDMTRRMHLQWRGEPADRIPVPKRRGAEGFSHGGGDIETGRVEGFYHPKNQGQHRRPSRQGHYDDQPNVGGIKIISDMVPGYPLPSPYGDTRSGNCYSCN